MCTMTIQKCYLFLVYFSQFCTLECVLLLVNPLKLSCWNFNLVNVLSQISCASFVLLISNLRLFRQQLAAIAYTQVRSGCPSLCRSEANKCSDLVKFCSMLVLWGWLLKST